MEDGRGEWHRVACAEYHVKIFWSWQSDTPFEIGRYLIRDALKDAIGRLKKIADIEEPVREALHLDQDIQNIPGSPDLSGWLPGTLRIGRRALTSLRVTAGWPMFCGEPIPSARSNCIGAR